MLYIREDVGRLYELLCRYTESLVKEIIMFKT